LLSFSIFAGIIPSIFTRLHANTGTIILLGMIGRFALLGRPFAFHVVALCWGGVAFMSIAVSNLALMFHGQQDDSNLSGFKRYEN
jgi:hypothetical protein